MFIIHEPQQLYKDPWAIPFEQRFRNLCSGKRRVAYFYERPDTSTFRYRVYNMIQVLHALGKDIGAAFFCNDDRAAFNKIVDNADVIVICRARYDGHLNTFISRARAQGKRVIFDVDDLVFDTKYLHLILKTLDQDLNHPAAWDHWFAYMGRIGATLNMCDAAITTNNYLASRLTEFSGLNATVIPNFMNQEQLTISDRIFQEKLDSSFARNQQIHLGYFSGTPTHNRDFAMAGNALADIMREDDRVRLLVVGFLELKGGLKEFSGRIQTLPLHDFINLQRIMSLVEINIVPLLDNGFTNCKSELKYFEAAAVGTLTVATPIHTYAGAIRNGENGYLSRSTEWPKRLGQMIEDLPRYQEMAVRAHTMAMDRYAWFNQLPLIEKALFF